MATLRKTLFSVRVGSATGASSADRGKDINPQHLASIPDEDFQGKGVDLSVKYFGRCLVTSPRGEKMAQDAMRELKQQLQATSGHKQRVTINLSMFGVQLFESATMREIAKHAVKSISFMTIDPEDTKAFAYIAAEGPDEQNPKRIFRLYCFKSEKQTVLITKSMMRIFKLAHKEKERQSSVKSTGGKPVQRRGTTKNSPLPPLPTGQKTDESPYATLSSTVTPTLATKVTNRNSLALIDFNAAGGDGGDQANQDTSEDAYAAVNRGAKASFSMDQFGLPSSSVNDVTALPAPIGMPFKDMARNPFQDDSVEARPGGGGNAAKPAVRSSTLASFDPAFPSMDGGGGGGGGGGGSGDVFADGFGSDFSSFAGSKLDDGSSDTGQPASDVYAVPRFPPIRAVLSDGDDDDTGRDSGDLFGS